jgi:phage-related minor tail protein
MKGRMNMRNIGKKIMVTLMLGVLIAAVTACKAKEGPMEQSGKAIDKAAEKSGEKIDKAIEKAGEKIEKAGEQLKDSTKK